MTHSQPPLEPWDDSNRALVEAVHPPEWRNPAPQARYDLVVIGAGTAGLVTAAGAAGLGARVALVERHLMGGDCLNYGCVPSKALLRCAHAAAEARRAADFGLPRPAGPVDFPGVMQRLRRLRAAIAPHDSARRFASLGVDVFFGNAQFQPPDTVSVAGASLHFSRAVIASGARAAMPDLPGLAEAGALTNETVFNLVAQPARLVVLGGGPVGCELAQAFQRLGTQVTLVHNKPRLLDREDPEAAALLQEALAADGVRLLPGASVERIERGTGPHRQIVRVRQGHHTEALPADALLVATGRRPNVDGLGLDAMGIAYDARHGVRVDDFLRTTHPRVFACGDVCLGPKFTHAADFSARIVLQNALFALGPLGRRRFSALNIPRAVYTDPEIAHTGLDDDALEARGLATDTYTVPFQGVDRALTDGETVGFARVRTARGTDRILSATVVGKHAGELISELTLAMDAGLGLGRLASTIHPYPTRADALRKLGDAWQRTRLTPRARSILSALIRWRR